MGPKIAELKYHELRNVLRYPEDGSMFSTTRNVGNYMLALKDRGYRIHLTVDDRELAIPRVYRDDRLLVPFLVLTTAWKITHITQSGETRIAKDNGD